MAVPRIETEMKIDVNGREYWLDHPLLVVVCMDGCADEYIDAAMSAGRAPNLTRFGAEGWRSMARACLPSFTNVNNCAIVTGTPPAQTGMVGNYILDPKTGNEVMTNSSQWLRNGTILAAAAKAGRKVAMVTAKDKLREMLSKDCDGIALSSEKAPEWIEKRVGAKPEIYSGDASLYVLEAGTELARSGDADFLYLSLTDYIQHSYAPDEPEAIDFVAGIDTWLGELDRLGARIVATADHGMNHKCDPSGGPQVRFLESELVAKFGDGIRVLCPITDPYVVHHGALGSAVVVHLPDPGLTEPIAQFLRTLPGITEVHDRDSAVRQLELPNDLCGDLTVLSGRDWVIGRRPEYHDLAQLHGELRSHGGRYEEMVPFFCNFRFEFVCNGASA